MENKNLFIMAIVAVVAIVAIVTIITNTGPRSSENIVGQAVKPDIANSAKCTDTDGGIIYYLKGTANDGRNSGTDFCNTSIILTEYYCNNANKVTSITYSCPYGCLAGACKLQSLYGNLAVQTTPSAAWVYVDNNYKGMSPLTVYNLTNGTHPVSIMKTGYQDYMTFVSITPGQTAFLNVTLVANQTIQSCADSDGGLNYYLFGTVTWVNGTFIYNITDTCNGNTTLYERYCVGTTPSTQVYPCACYSGRCW